MKRLFIHIGLFAVACFAACKKTDVHPQTGEPVFSATFRSDAGFDTLAAGVDDYYMFTGFEKDSNDVYSFYGDLRNHPDSCAGNCGPSLKITFRDIQQRSSGVPDLNAALKPGEFIYASEGFTTILIGYLANFDASSTYVPASLGGSVVYEWSFGDSSLGQGAIAQHFYDTSFATDSVAATLNVKVPGTSFSSKQTKFIGQNGQPDCAVHIEYDSTAGDLLAVTPDSAVVYLWSTGSTSIYAQLDPAVNNYIVTVTTANGCTASASVEGLNANIIMQEGVLSARFDYELTPKDSIVPASALHLGEVIVEYRIDNVIYSSFSATQTAESFFALFQTEDYDANENGDPTKKLTVQFRCRLANLSNGDEIELIDGRAIIGVAYPK